MKQEFEKQVDQFFSTMTWEDAMEASINLQEEYKKKYGVRYGNRKWKRMLELYRMFDRMDVKERVEWEFSQFSFKSALMRIRMYREQYVGKYGEDEWNAIIEKHRPAVVAI